MKILRFHLLILYAEDGAEYTAFLPKENNTPDIIKMNEDTTASTPPGF